MLFINESLLFNVIADLAIGWFFRFCFRLRQCSFHWIRSDGVINGIERN